MSAVGNMGAKTISSEFKMNECTYLTSNCAIFTFASFF